MTAIHTANHRVAIIGAGMAGLSAGHALKSSGWDVELFDKGRSPGGRVATRRQDIDGNPVSFDHGARFITSPDQEFSRFLEPMIESGLLQRWTGRLGAWNGASIDAIVDNETRLVGVPGMSALPKFLAGGQTIHCSAKVSRIQESHPSKWRLVLDSGQIFGEFDAVIVAVPDAQTRDLMHSSGLTDALQKLPPAVLTPCWTVMLAYTKPVTLNFDAITCSKGPFDWIIRNSSKPQRHQGLDTWVLQLDAQTSAEHLEDEKQEMARLALDVACQMAPEFTHTKPVLMDSHRWRFALTPQSLVPSVSESRSMYLADLKIGFCGDWLGGGQIAAAWRSGLDLAGKLLKT